MQITRSTSFLAVAMALSFAGCGGSDESTREESIDVASNLATCTTLIERLCYQVRPTGSTRWALLYENIEGLNYEWGRQYSIRVRVTERHGAGAADAPSSTTTYKVLALVSSAQVPAETAFSLTTSWPASSIEKEASGHWTFLGVRLACSPGICQELESAKSRGVRVQLDFDHVNSPNGPLDLVGVSLPTP
jgi:hypothetical protein